MKKKPDISLKKKTKIIRKVDAKISSPLAIKKKQKENKHLFLYGRTERKKIRKLD